MREVWYAIPTINAERASACLPKWQAHGCRIAILIDKNAPRVDCAELVLEPDEYPGYFASVNLLVRAILAAHPADIIVTGGDDMDPDPGFNAGTLADQFYERFPDGFGVMQPTGDTRLPCDTICGSPWMGRAWCERAYGGTGPMPAGYRAYFGDGELKHVAEKLGVLWMRSDVSQFHHHPCRGGGPDWTGYQRKNAERHWRNDEDLFKARQKAGFPGHEPLVPHPVLA